MKYISGYILWTEHNVSFMVGLNIDTTDRVIEIFLGVFALEIGY